MARYRNHSCLRSSTSSSRCSSWSSSRRSASARSSWRGTSSQEALASRHRAPGKQLEHERHLKAVNEAADHRAARRGFARRQGQPQRGQGQHRSPRERRAEEAPAYAGGAPPGARRGPRPPRPVRVWVPDHSVVHRYARCLSYPEWGVGTVNGIPLHRRRRRRPAVGTGQLPGRRAHGAGGLVAVRGLLQAGPGRRACRALHDPRPSTRWPRATSRSPPAG